MASDMLNTHADGTLASSSTRCASSANTSILYGPDGASDSPMPRLSNVMISRLDLVATIRGAVPQSSLPQAKPWMSSRGVAWGITTRGCSAATQCAAFGHSLS
jgi:hypothetical protein